MTGFDRVSLAAAAGVDPWDLLDRLRAGDPAQLDEGPGDVDLNTARATADSSRAMLYGDSGWKKIPGYYQEHDFPDDPSHLYQLTR